MNRVGQKLLLFIDQHAATAAAETVASVSSVRIQIIFVAFWSQAAHLCSRTYVFIRGHRCRHNSCARAYVRGIKIVRVVGNVERRRKKDEPKQRSERTNARVALIDKLYPIYMHNNFSLFNAAALQ